MLGQVGLRQDWSAGQSFGLFAASGGTFEEVLPVVAGSGGVGARSLISAICGAGSWTGG